MIFAPSSRATMLMPGLFGNPFLPADEDPLLREATVPTAVAGILTRADHNPNRTVGFDARLFDLFGMTRAAGSDLPIAAVTRLADTGVADEAWWVRADPVYLEPRRSELVLHAGVELDVSEAERLVTELTEALAADGWLLEAPNPNRWYLKPTVPAQLTTTPLTAVMGHNIDSYLPRGADAPVWHTRLNEFQILMHSSPVNVARQSQARRPANSVWFWGGGRLPAPGASRYTQVWSNEPLAIGLAWLASLATAAVPADAQQWFDSAGTGDHLVVLDGLADAAQRGDHHGWNDALEKLSADWIEPLVEAVGAGTLAELAVLADVGPEFRYRRGHRWRFWKRKRTLADLRGAA